MPRVALLLVALLLACFHAYGGGPVPPPAPESEGQPNPPANHLPALAGAAVAATATDEPAPPRAPRTIALLFLADEHVRLAPAWRDVVKAAVARAASAFAPLAMDLEVSGFGEWETPTAEPSLDLLLDRLEQQPKRDADVVVGLVGGPSAGSGAVDDLGRARALFGDAVALRWQPVDRLGVVLAHELAHLFGAVHVAEASVMRETVADAGAHRLDAANAAVVEAARDRRFARDLPPHDAAGAKRVLRAVERLLRDDRHNRGAEDVRTDLIEYLRTIEQEALIERRPGAAAGEARRLVAEGRRAAASGDEGKALAFFREALRVCAECAGAHLESGRTLLARGRADEALGELFAETRLDPDGAEAYRLIADAHDSLGRPAQARDARETARRLAAKHAAAKER
ncbi:MAG: hypothetical protein AABZ30_05215 [Myxococcota bacterium]